MSFKEWEKLIEEFKRSGKSQAQWCRENNLKVRAFNYQYNRLKRISQNIQSNTPVNWLPVKLESPMYSKLNIKIGKAVIEIESGYDEKLLLSVIRTLEETC